MRCSGGESMQENELERLVREAVAETLAQLEREGRWIAEGTLAVGSDWVVGFAFLRRRCCRAGKVVT